MNENQKNVIEGFSLALSMLIVSLFLYMNPEFLKVEKVSYITGTILGIIGIVGIFIELGRLNEKFEESLKDIIASVLLALCVYTIYLYFTNMFVKFVIIFFALISLYAFIRGLLKIIVNIINEKKSKILFTQLIALLLNILLIGLTVLQIVQIFNLI